MARVSLNAGIIRKAFWNREFGHVVAAGRVAGTNHGRLYFEHRCTAYLDVVDDLYAIEREGHAPDGIWRTNPLGAADRGYVATDDLTTIDQVTYRRWTLTP